MGLRYKRRLVGWVEHGCEAHHPCDDITHGDASEALHPWVTPSRGVVGLASMLEPPYESRIDMKVTTGGPCARSYAMNDRPAKTFCHRTRREFLWEAGAGFTGVALAGPCSAIASSIAPPPMSPRRAPITTAPGPPHFAPKAKSVIFLFMYGGPSQVDTFDYKPTLYNLDGQTIPCARMAAAGIAIRGASSGRSGASGSTGSAASRSAISSQTSRPVPTTSRSSIR